MANRLNHLFQTAPRQFLERTVLFMDGLTTPEAVAQARNRLTHFIDLEQAGTNARARLLANPSLYQDRPLAAYFLSPSGITLIPRENPPHTFVFLPEFTACRLLVTADGESWLRLHLEEKLSGRVPAPDRSKYLSSFAYWDHTTGDLVGVIRATAVLMYTPEHCWQIFMQQIVGIPGHEVVRQTFQASLL